MEKKNLTCIGCPMGCQITVEVEGEEVFSVTGRSLSPEVRRIAAVSRPKEIFPRKKSSPAWRQSIMSSWRHLSESVMS